MIIFAKASLLYKGFLSLTDTVEAKLFKNSCMLKITFLGENTMLKFWEVLNDLIETEESTLAVSLRLMNLIDTAEFASAVTMDSYSKWR
jgi:hypothetical protein